MQIKNAKNWSDYSTSDSVFFCSGLFLLITASLFVIGPNFYSDHPYKFYFLGATMIAYIFGFRSAITFIIISSLFASIYFIAPFGVFRITGDDLQRYLINLLFGSAAIVLIEILQRERCKSKLLLLVSESRYLILLHRDNRLLNQLKRNKS